MKHTYSRKAAKRRKHIPGDQPDETLQTETSPDRPRKRQKIEVEVVLPATPSPSRRVHNGDSARPRGNDVDFRRNTDRSSEFAISITMIYSQLHRVTSCIVSLL